MRRARRERAARAARTARAGILLAALAALAGGCTRGDEPGGAPADATSEAAPAHEAGTGASQETEEAGTAASQETEVVSAPAERDRPQVFLLGIDGLDPGLVRRWTADGSLPNLARLIDGGLMTEIDCVVGTSSPVVWTTVATGVPPPVHGITGFRIGEDPVNASHRKRPTFWNILSDHGVDVATVGWMVSWPAEEDVGIMISDRAWWGDFEDKVSPAGVVEPQEHAPSLATDEILTRFASYDFDEEWESLRQDDPRYSIHYLLRHRLLNIFRRDTIYAGAARELARERDLDVLALYLQGTDYVEHGFWQWFDPEPFRRKGWRIPDEDVEALGSIIPQYYRYVDSLVGEILPLLDEDALVILLSDHGFQASTGFRNGRDYSIHARYLSGTHREKATLILSGPQVRKGAQPDGRITHFDVLPTLLFALDLPRAKDQGRPLAELFTEEFASSREERVVDTYATDEEDASGPVRSELDQEIVEELRSLGYIR